jgi:hypothetical protein
MSIWICLLDVEYNLIMLLLVWLWQVQENDIWNDLDKHELAEHVGSDNAIYMFAKERAMETINRMLDTRTNSMGYVLPLRGKLVEFLNVLWLSYFMLTFFVYRVKELKCPDMIAEQYKPSSCRIRQWITEHALLIFPVCAVVFHSKRQPLMLMF